MKNIAKILTAREMSLVNMCMYYSDNNPNGLPGHTLMIIIAKLVGYIITKEKEESK